MMTRCGEHTHVLRSHVWTPGNKSDLAPASLPSLEFILDIVHGISASDALVPPLVLALGVHQLVAKVVVVGLLGCLLDDDFFPVVADLVDNPLDVLVEFELIEGADAFGVDGDSRRGY